MYRYFIDDRRGQYVLHDRTLGHDTPLGIFPREQADLAQRVVALLNDDEAWKAAAAGFDPEQALIWRTGK